MEIMRLSQDDILNAVRNSKRSSLSIRELIAVLRIPAGAKKTLHRLLRDMERQRLLKRIKGGRYALARPAAMHEGIVSLNRRGDGSVEMTDGNFIRIAARYLGNAADGVASPTDLDAGGGPFRARVGGHDRAREVLAAFWRGLDCLDARRHAIHRQQTPDDAGRTDEHEALLDA